jgi:ferredoxin--NADP+ reductase
MFSALQATDKSTVETITAIHHWTPALYSFKTTRPRDYRFTPGQYARLGLGDAQGNLIWRAYSIVSAINDDHLEFYLVDVPGGAFTSILKQLAPGDSILLDKQSFGFMTAERFSDGEELWMLATGTGLGPFVSILREPGVWQKFRHLVLVHSVRHANELAYQEELRALQQQFSHLPATLHTVHTITRDDALAGSPISLRGRITTLLQNGELERHVGLPLKIETSRVMLCGNPQMIEETRRLLHERGMRPCRRALPGQFVTENYW